MVFMIEQSQKPSPLRLIAAVMLGIIVGSILFFILALFIGSFNDLSGMNLSVSTNIAENFWSLILLIVLNVLCIAGFCWKVWTTPPTETEFEE
jgi:uncharacterized protein YqhQ